MKNKVNSFVSINTAGTAVDGVTTNTAQSINDTLSEKDAEILVSISDRMVLSTNKKVCDRVDVLTERWKKNGASIERDLFDMQDDFLFLIEGLAQDSLVSVYPGWEKEDFIEIYRIFYGE